MAEIEEELSVDIPSDKVRVINSATGDKIIMEDVQLSYADAATLAWLIKQSPEAVLVFHLSIKS